jgi:hypothetical protein
MDYLAFIGFLTAHWATISAFLVGVPGLALALRTKAYWMFFNLALELVKKAALQELSGSEKRKWCAQEGYELLPTWAQKFVTKQMCEDWVEKAYQQLKNEGKV